MRLFVADPPTSGALNVVCRAFTRRARRSLSQRAMAGALPTVCAALALTIAMAPSQAGAQCATTDTNQTCTNPSGTTVSGGVVGINDTATLTLTNFGTITGLATGISANDAKVTNSGTISGGSGAFSIGINVFGTTNVTNSGSILVTGAGGLGIKANDTANVVNSGIIAATGAGSEGIFAKTANVINSGTVSGGGVGISASVTNL